ncbi:hypothetical protein QNI16_31455 [Cytophagaceae bacterium YF14B1]|uniref:Uncharacterized protein n=1 Tax=Xanthocytophaga flava TaxID=3048013 RepID=A0AAE3UAT5_9BACT|nr:hypothetical protein [Xanthocytophaga flavus]MDJ1485057.1 hypothetical protein [Xanthocytophaga flavus]
MISIKIIEKEDSHKDLQLEIGDFKQIAGSYYFFFDDTTETEYNETTLRILIEKLIKSWKESLSKLQTGDKTYLPFDFSDQYIGCIQCILDPTDRLLIRYGVTTKFTGSGINPSQNHLFSLNESDFTAITETFHYSLSDLLQYPILSIA